MCVCVCVQWSLRYSEKKQGAIRVPRLLPFVQEGGTGSPVFWHVAQGVMIAGGEWLECESRIEQARGLWAPDWLVCI